MKPGRAASPGSPACRPSSTICMRTIERTAQFKRDFASAHRPASGAGRGLSLRGLSGDIRPLARRPAPERRITSRNPLVPVRPRRTRTLQGPGAGPPSMWQVARENEARLPAGCGSSSPTDFSPVHRRFLLADGPFGALCAGTSAHGPFFGQPARPDQRCLGASIRPTGPPPGHSRSVLVACRGKGDASEMAVVTTTRLSGRAFRVALGATSGRGRLNRRRHRAGETLETVVVCPLVGNAQRRWRES